MEKRDDLDLENLAMPKCFCDSKAMADIKPPKEGGLTDDEIAAMFPDYDDCMKIINECIYDATVYGALGFSLLRMRKLQFDRMKALFGFPSDHDCFTWIETHNAHDPEAVEKLVSDALRTGKWKELPDELQPMYHDRKKGLT